MRRMISRIDIWIGKTFFVPPIIKLCHLTRQSQYAVARLFWFMAMLSGLYRAENMIDYVIFGLGSVFMMLTASLRADRPTRSQRWFRMFAVGSFVMKVISSVASGIFLGIEFWFFVLIAEYAATIRTLPPRETKGKSARAAEAGAG